MKNRFRLIHRGERGRQFYCVDSETNRRFSLRTKDRDAAEQIVLAKNQALRQPALNLQIARLHSAAADPALSQRTWETLFADLVATKRGENKERWKRAIKDPAFKPILKLPLVETLPDHFLRILHPETRGEKKAKVSTHVLLRRAHNYAVGLGWLPWPVLSPRQTNPRLCRGKTRRRCEHGVTPCPPARDWRKRKSPLRIPAGP